MRNKILSVILAGVLCFNGTVPVLGVGPPPDWEAAAIYVRDQGIMTGDQNGNLNLNSGLTRAELAVILTRLSDDTGDMGRNAAYYRTICPFTDVPEWTMPYAGYCAEKKLMAGYGNKQFGPNDPVTPAAACTVMLRYLDCPTSQWTYATACKKAAELGLLPDGAAVGPSITRGNVAVLIYRALNGEKLGGGHATLQGVGDGYLANGKDITEENVLELLRQIEQDWPTGTIWGTHNTSGTSKNEIPCTEIRHVMDSYRVSATYGCSGYASMVSSLIFGDQANPARRLEDLSQIRPGDIIFMVRNSTGKVWHVTVALESPNEKNAFHITDGNAGETVQWPDRENPYGRDNLDCYRGEDKSYHLEVWTRYPESVPYTGNSVMGWPTGK